MNQLLEVFQQYPHDAVLFHVQRGNLWKEQNKAKLQSSVHEAMTALDLDKPWEEIHANPVQEALANSIWSTVLACNGPKLDTTTLVALNKARFGSDYVSQVDGSHIFTSNHLSVSGKLKPVDNDGSIMKHHMPTFATVEGGKPTIGDVSPISLEQEGDVFVLSLQTPGGHVWQKQFEVLPAAAFSTSIKDIASPCASSFQVTILRPTCQENCVMCTVPKGNGEVSHEYKEKVSQALDVLIGHAASNHHKFQQTLSGGTLSSDDGGFSTAHEWGLAMIEEKTQGKDISVQLQLEMVLPPDKTTWQPILQKLHFYVEKGWKISFAVNMEILHDEWEGLFLQGAAKGASTVADHLAFAKLLSEQTDGKIQMNSLVMFGMKPVGMPYGEYLSADLAVLQQLIAAGIKPDYQPVKIESGTVIEAYPLPDPIFLLVQDLALKHMIAKAQLPISPGCVGGCNACDQSAESKALLIAAKKAGVAIPGLVAPILDKLGPTYKKVFQEVFV